MAEALGIRWLEVANAAWIGVGAACLGLAAAQAARRRSAPLAHAAATLAAIAMLAAPVLAWVGGSWTGQLAWPAAAEPWSEAQPAPLDRRQFLASGVPFAPAQTLSVPVPPETAPNADAASGRPAAWLDAVLAVWLLGSLACLLKLAFSWLAAHRLRVALNPAEPAVHALLHRLAAEMKVPAPGIGESAAVAVPVALGPWRPTIVLPRGYAAGGGAEELSATLRHELGHLAAGHHAAALAQAIAETVFWWNPIAWFLGRAQAELQEEIADNFVLAASADRAAYARLLLRLAEGAQASPGPRLGLAMLRRRSAFPRRIESLLKKERPLMTRLSPLGSSSLAFVAFAAAALLSLATLRGAAEPEPPPSGSGAPEPRRGQTLQGQQSGSFQVESFEKGKAVPFGKAEMRTPPGQPPSITYPGSRSSSGWIDVGGSQVAVSEGVEWQGKIAYLSLTFDLVVADAKTKKALWRSSVGAFWDTITFENQAKAGEPAKWALLLKSSRKPEYQQAYDLSTGAKLELKGGPAEPDGKPFTPRQSWSGSAGVRDEKHYALVRSADEWTKLRRELFGAEPKGIPDAKEIDFAKEMLLVCYAGKATNWNGISVQAGADNDQRLLLRLRRATYQSMGDVGHEHPYGLFALPKLEGKKLVLEYNRQNLIGGPEIWREFLTLDAK